MELNDFILRLRALLDEVGTTQTVERKDEVIVEVPVDKSVDNVENVSAEVVVVDPKTDGNNLHEPVANIADVVVVDTKTDTSELVQGTRNDSSLLVEASVANAIENVDVHKQESTVEDNMEVEKKDPDIALSNLPQQYATFIEQLQDFQTRLSIMEQNYDTLMTQFNIVGKAVENVSAIGDSNYTDALKRYTSQI